MEWAKQNWWVLVVIGLVLFFGLRWAFSEEDEGDDDNGDGSGGGGGSGIDWDPDPLAKDLKECMDGINVTACSNDWRRIRDLQTDDQVRALNDHFNENYGEGYTLTEWIESQSEVVLWGESAKEQALARLDKALSS